MSERHTVATVEDAMRRLADHLDEKHRRQFAGLWAARLGYGGVQHVARVTGLSRTTIIRGRREALAGHDPHPDRIRAPGGGRKPAEKKIPA